MRGHSNISQRNNSASVLTWQILITMLSRLLLYTARRFVYPFAPVLSRGMGVPLTAVTSLIAANWATGFLGLFFGPLADRFGYRLMMIGGLSLLILGMTAAGFWPLYGVVLAAIFLAGLGIIIFGPAVQAYAGERVPFHRRGLAIGVLEFSYAGSTLLGIPLVGLIIDRWGWRAPFFFLAGSGLVSLLILVRLVPKDGKKSRHRPVSHIWIAWQQIAHKRVALGALVFGFLIGIAIDNLFVVYGIWLEESFGLSIIALGLGVGVIGAAEFLGEILTALLADRLGLKRSVMIGLFFNIVGYVLLPLIGGTISRALAGLFFIFLAFEFSIVVFVSLCTEIMPQLRATMMSFFLAAGGLGRIIGVLIGGPVWLYGGIAAIGLVSASITGLSLISLAWGLRDWEHR